MSSGALPAGFYGDPMRVLVRNDARRLYQAQGCKACAHHDTEDLHPCTKRLLPGRHWCRGFDEK